MENGFLIALLQSVNDQDSEQEAFLDSSLPN